MPFDSFSHTILFGTKEEVAIAIANGHEINIIDEYGFTPLIEAAIANKTDVGQLLIKNGANVNQPDSTGRYPLHWTVDNYNLSFTKLLLDAGANPNAYSRSGQAILVVPLLREHKDLKQLLYHYGAKLSFAQDYINAKLLGHRFELAGETHLVDCDGNFILLDYEGFMFEFTCEILKNSLKRYKNHYEARKLTNYFKNLERLIKSLGNSAELTKYQQYTLDLKNYQHRLHDIFLQEPLVIPLGYDGHAITAIKYKNFFVKCDRGAYSKILGDSVNIYYINKPDAFSQNFLENLVYTPQTEFSIHVTLNNQLGLKKIDSLPVPPQVVGNCSWANVEAIIPTLMYLLTCEDTHKKLPATEPKKLSIEFFNAWHKWDKERALEECIQNFYRSERAHKAAKASILAAIFVHRLNYKEPNDLRIAEKLFPILKTPGYEYILKSYLEVYGRDNKDPIGLNLRHMIDIITHS